MHSFEVVGTAIDVDQLLKEVVGGLFIGVDVGDDGLLFRGERWSVLGDRDDAEGGSEEGKDERP